MKKKHEFHSMALKVIQFARAKINRCINRLLLNMKLSPKNHRHLCATHPTKMKDFSIERNFRRCLGWKLFGTNKLMETKKKKIGHKLTVWQIAWGEIIIICVRKQKTSQYTYMVEKSLMGTSSYAQIEWNCVIQIVKVAQKVNRITKTPQPKLDFPSFNHWIRCCFFEFRIALAKSFRDTIFRSVFIRLLFIKSLLSLFAQ